MSSKKLKDLEEIQRRVAIIRHFSDDLLIHYYQNFACNKEIIKKAYKIVMQERGLKT